MAEKLLSVLMSIYNDEKYLAETLDSIFNAVSKENEHLVEFIFVNDGSTDKTQEILEDYKLQYNFILINQENNGLAKAQKQLISIATGKYEYSIGHDDILEPNAIDKILNYLQEFPATDLLLFDYFEFGSNLVSKKTHKSGVYFEHRDGQSVFATLRKNDMCVVPEWNKVVLRNLILENDIFSGNPYTIDIETTPKIYAMAKEVGYLPEALYNYRIHSDSMGRCSKFKVYNFTKCRIHALDALCKLINKNSLTDDFIKTLLDYMSDLYMSALSGIKLQGVFEDSLISDLYKYTWLLKYGKWDRKYIFRWVVKFFGLKTLYALRFHNSD